MSRSTRARPPVNYCVDMEVDEPQGGARRQDDDSEFEDELSDSPAPKQQRTSRRQHVTRHKVIYVQSESEEDQTTDSDDGDQLSEDPSRGARNTRNTRTQRYSTASRYGTVVEVCVARVCL